MKDSGFTEKQAEAVVEVLGNLLANIPTREEMAKSETKIILWVTGIITGLLFTFAGIIIGTSS